MTKKWLWYVCVGLICCSSLAYVYAKQTTGVSKIRTDRDALIEKLESVREQIRTTGNSPDLEALEIELRAQLYPETRQKIDNALIGKLRMNAEGLENAQRSSAPSISSFGSAPSEIEIAKAAYERMLNDEMLPGDKALISANFPEPEAVRTEDNNLDDNGGTWFVWTGAVNITDNVCQPNVDLSVAGLGTVLDVEVKIDTLTHTWDSDLDIYLIAPNADTIMLSTDNGGSGDNIYNLVLNDEAATSVTTAVAPMSGEFIPEEPLSALDGIAANGTWSLRVCDDAGGDVGVLRRWSLQILATAGGQVPELTVTQLSPCGSMEPNGAANVSLRVSNVGPVASPATTAHFNFDSGVTTDMLAVPAIPPSSFFDVFFATTINVTVGAHTLQGYVDAVVGDATQVNDSASCNITGAFCYDFTADLTTLPYSHTFTTVGAGDNCALRAGADVVYQVIVPVAGNYTFSTCNTAVGWDAYMYITSACCGGTTLAQDDDACNTAAGLMPVVTCLSLAAGTYYVDIEPFGSTSTGGYTLDITMCAPCDVVCDPGDTPENAPTEVPDSTFMVDQDPNGGCNNVLGPLWGAIQCGETICGNGFTWVTAGGSTYRDTDWYLFTVATYDTVTLTCTAEFNALFGIVSDVATCTAPAFIVSNTTTAQCTTRSVSTCLAPGTYAAWCGTASGVTFAYGTNPTYRLTMSCVPCTPPTGRCCYQVDGVGQCSIGLQLDCDAVGGTWTSGITDCVTSPCPTGRCCYLDAGTPACAINEAAVCTFLGGSWTSGVTDCIASPCPTGRCCYSGGCLNTTDAHCTLLAGTWNSAVTCETLSCPVTPTNDECETELAVAIPPYCSIAYDVILEGWTATCPETVTGDGVTIPEYTSTGPDAFFTFTLTECRKIAIKASGPTTSNTYRDAHISVKDVCCTGTFILGNDDYGSNDSLPVYSAAGWLPLANRPLNSFGSMVAGLLPAGTYHVRAGIFSSGTIAQYELTFYDYGPCVLPNLCDPGDLVTNLTVHRDSITNITTEANVTLRWTNANAGDYLVYSSIAKNNDGDPDGPDADLKAGDDTQWTLETLVPLTLPAGDVSWDRPAGFEDYINFVVVPDCDPTPPSGRCCYVDGGSYACANTTEAACGTLGGNWTIYLDCACASTPCPQEGRCCYLDINNMGACDDLLESDCLALGGTWTAGVSCASAPCELGRCCYLDVNSMGACADVQVLECNFLVGTWTAGTTCAATPCEVGRCCYSGGCEDAQIERCDFLAGTWSAGLSCGANPCPLLITADECAAPTALVLPDGGSVSGYVDLLTALTVSCTDTCDYISNGVDMFASFTITGNRRICITGDGDFADSHISLYADGFCCVDPATSCNDDWGNFTTLAWHVAAQEPDYVFESLLEVELTAGTYVVRCGSYGSGAAAYTLTVYDNGVW